MGFRARAQAIAMELNLMGYAKNLPNGMVEIAVQGEEEEIDQFFHQLQLSYPEASFEKSSTRASELQFSGFSIH